MSEIVDSDQTIIGGSQSSEALFASAWCDDNSPPPPLTEYLPRQGEEGYLATLERLIQIELQQSWRRSTIHGSHKPYSLEEYIERFPVLRMPEVVQRLARVEFIARAQYGDRPDAQEYVRRFPDFITPQAAAKLLDAGQLSLSRPDQAPSSDDLGMLGGYKLLEQIGEGGMGVVYRALQPGAKRIVALKVIRSSVTSAGDAFRQKAESRFRNEIQAASKLEHENIVPVCDAGSVGDLMFFAMRFVDGKSLSELVRPGPMENKLAAKYLVGAARGVAEAHRRGIIHRDLKPQNVMVEARTGQPLVADFGLAKLLDTDEQLTKTGEAIGTPSYMPPEQIGDAGSVDQRCDVYSLGATLYHLLTGRPPFQAANTLGTMRQVLYDEPVPPKRLNSAVDADLETISLKCPQKEPARRYQSAEEFIADLERYLRGEPILARPIGRVERLNRWRRRNPMEAGLAATAIVLTLLALTATTIGYRSTKAALRESQENLAVAKEAVDQLYTEVSEIDLQNQPGLQPLKRKLLGKALDYYEKLLKRHDSDTELTAEFADSHFRVGRITEEVTSIKDGLPHFQQAAQIQRTLLKASPTDPVITEKLSDSLNSIGRAQQRLQNLDDSQSAYEEARGLRDTLVKLNPGNREFQRKLANVIMNSALLKVRRGDLDAAAADHAAAQQIRQMLLDESREDLVVRDFAKGAFNQGILEKGRENWDASAQFFGTSIEQFRKLVEAHPESLSDRFELGVASVLLGDVLAAKFDDQPALDSYGIGRGILEQLANENPQVLAYQERIGTAVVSEAGLHMNLAKLFSESEPADPAAASAHLSKAEPLLSRGVTALKTVVDAESSRTGPRHDLATIYLMLGDVKNQQGNPGAARQAWIAGCEVLEPIKGEFDRNADCAEIWAELQDKQKLLSPPESK